MGERIPQGGGNLRVRGVRVPRGNSRVFFPPFFDFSGNGAALILSLILEARKELSRGYLGVCWR